MTFSAILVAAIVLLVGWSLARALITALALAVINFNSFVVTVDDKSNRKFNRIAKDLIVLEPPLKELAEIVPPNSRLTVTFDSKGQTMWAGPVRQYSSWFWNTLFFGVQNVYVFKVNPTQVDSVILNTVTLVGHFDAI